MLAYLLIIVTHVSGGSVVSSLEFADQNSCLSAKEKVMAMVGRVDPYPNHDAQCIARASKSSEVKNSSEVGH